MEREQQPVFVRNSFESRNGPGLHGRPGLETPGLPLPPSEVPFIGSSLKLR
jgi:hypothetical protein